MIGNTTKDRIYEIYLEESEVTEGLLNALSTGDDNNHIMALLDAGAIEKIEEEEEEDEE